MNYVKGLVGLSALLVLASCANPVEKVVRTNLEGLQKQNIELVMSTIDKTSPAYESTRKEVSRLLQDYNLEFKFESLDVIKQPENEQKAMEKAMVENQDATGLDEAIDSFITEEERAEAENKKHEQQMASAKNPLIAQVKVVQVTRPRDKADERFHSNRVQVIHTLHKYPTDEKPEWKIYESDIRSVDVIANEED